MRVEDLDVYQYLFKLTMEIHDLTMDFPKYEMYELGSQLRRSSNSAPANLAEGFGNKPQIFIPKALVVLKAR